MFGYGRSNFTWNGTLKELEAGSQASCRGKSVDVCVHACVCMCVIVYSNPILAQHFLKVVSRKKNALLS